jgi:hypothetical protein
MTFGAVTHCYGVAHLPSVMPSSCLKSFSSSSISSASFSPMLSSTDHDTGAFAVASIRGWWRFEGRYLYPQAQRILITADAGGSNGSRLRLWKVELQKLADETELCLSICHFPPGTSKWNKIEHRLFSFISSNWRGEPLRDYETIVNLISKTTTAKGLKVTCRLDRRKYPIGRRVSNQEMVTVQPGSGRDASPRRPGVALLPWTPRRGVPT